MEKVVWLLIVIYIVLLETPKEVQETGEQETENLQGDQKKHNDLNNNDNVLINLMSNNSHNAVKHEMIYLLELFRFGLIENFTETVIDTLLNNITSLLPINVSPFM